MKEQYKSKLEKLRNEVTELRNNLMYKEIFWKRRQNKKEHKSKKKNKPTKQNALSEIKKRRNFKKMR